MSQINASLALSKNNDLGNGKMNSSNIFNYLLNNRTKHELFPRDVEYEKIIYFMLQFAAVEGSMELFWDVADELRAGKRKQEKVVLPQTPEFRNFHIFDGIVRTEGSGIAVSRLSVVYILANVRTVGSFAGCVSRCFYKL